MSAAHERRLRRPQARIPNSNEATMQAWRRVQLLLLLTGVAGRLPLAAEAKVFERCELAQLLHQRHALPLAEVATWVCIAQHSSGYNTAAYGGNLASGSHGLFQISDEFWCSPPGKGFGCNVPCQRLRDNDLSDDLACARIIHAEHARIAGDGFTAWNAYAQYCRHNANAYVADCFGQSARIATTIPTAARGHTPATSSLVPQGFSGSSADRRGKVYSRCELAQELYYRHQLPMEQIPTWVCIAQHESNYDTAAVGRLNADGSADHGLFQISDLYWCGHDQLSGGKGCGLPCSRLLNNDISDDVRCIRRIHDEHTRISGDGFTAWTVYNRDCRQQRYDHVAACFKQKPPQLANTMPNAVAPQKQHATHTLAHAFAPTRTHSHQTPASLQFSQRYQANPFLNGAFAARPTINTNTHLIPNTLHSSSQHHHHHSQTPVHKAQKADAPVILTLPHMLGASNEYTRMIRGLKPDIVKHQTYVDVQHLTGTPLQGGKRVQFNMFLKSINRISITENLTTVLMPAIWVEEGIQLNGEMVSMFKQKLINSLKTLNIIHWASLIGGGAVAAVSLIYYLVQRQQPEEQAPLK